MARSKVKHTHKVPGGPAQAQEDPEGGRGAKARGSLDSGRGGDALATLDLGSILTSDGTVLTPRIPLSAYRRPSMKNVGYDAEGKTVQHKYDERIAARVAQWAACGADENYICHMLNMRPGRLKELYADVIEHAATSANMNVAAAAYRDALVPGAHVQQKFWLKARANWRDGESQPTAVAPLAIHIHE